MAEDLNGHEKMLLLFGWFVGSDAAQERAMRGLINRGFATGWGEPLTERGRETRRSLKAPGNGDSNG